MAFRVSPQDLLPDFLVSMRENIAGIAQLLTQLQANPADSHALSEVHRQWHSMKSAAALMQLSDLSEAAQAQELIFAELLKANTPASPTVLDDAKQALTELESALEAL